MKKNRSLMISIFITVFLVVIAGGVATTVLANNLTPKSATLSAADAIKTYQAREAEYKALLDKANRELEQANQQLTALAGSSTQDPQGQNSSEAYPVSVEMAKSIAYQIARDYPLNDPELVNYNGTIAYEVKFKNGTIYVDATTGQVIFNGLASSTKSSITADQAAQLAIAYVGNTNILNIEVGSYNGSRIYMVGFTNGQVIYVNLNGKIVAVKMPSSTSSSHEQETEHETPETDD